MARILCIEDSKEYQIYLASILKEHSLVFVESVQAAVRVTESGRDHFELILLDVSLPDGNGIKILPQLKDSLLPAIVPVIVLSADNDILTKVAAFGVGADDYVAKPADPSELRARIEARLRGAKSIMTEKSQINYGGLTIDLNKMSVEIQPKDEKRLSLELTPYEFKILKLMLSRPGQVYTRELIIDSVWGTDKFITARTVDAHVSHLRKKIIKSQIQIETVLSTGYRLALKDKNLTQDT